MKMVVVMLAYLSAAIVCLGNTYYVDANGTGDFATIQAAINAATAGDVVILQPGTYTGNGNRDINFIGKAVIIRGATGNPNDCIIDCQGNSSNPHRGFKFISGEDGNSVLEAIKITNGYGQLEGPYSAGYFYSSGGAIYCNGSSPSLNNCIIINNSAQLGGGFCNINSNPIIRDCLISNNSSTNNGGGIWNYYSNPKIINCAVSGNHSFVGGGIYNGYSGPTITNCVIGNNSADYGGGIGSDYASPNLKGCVISSNTSSYGGGGIYNVESGLNIINCTIRSNNSQVSSGGGVYNPSGSVNMSNCIVWGNNSWIYGTAIVTYSDIQGGYAGTGNINADPCFIDAYHISIASPCLDAGDPNYVAGPNETDIDGDPRVMVRIDMGADEVASTSAPLLVIAPQSLNFTANGLYSGLQSQQITIKNYGTGVLNWQISEANGCNWLSAFPATGQVNSGESNNVVITVNPNIAGYGTHICQLLITATGAQNSPQVVTVNLEVLRPAIGVNGMSFNFTAHGKSDTSVAGQQLVISNTGYDTLKWHIEIPDCNWLIANPSSGQVTDGNSVVILTVDPSKAAYGNNNATINIIDANASNSPKAVTAALQVSGPSISVSPSSLYIYAERNTKVEGTF